MSSMLEARVVAQNRANAVAAAAYSKLAVALRPFIGKPVIKRDGSLRHCVSKALPELPNTPELRVVFRHSWTKLTWKVISSQPAGDVWVYMHAYVVVAELDEEGKLERIVPPPKYRTDYKVEEVQKLREQCKKVRAQLEELRDALEPFGEYDY